MIEEGATLWRVGAAAVDSAERQVADAAANGPAALTTCTVTAFAFVCAKQEELQICLRDRYGIVLDDSPEHGPRVQVVDKERAQPMDGFDVAQGLDTLIRLMTYNAAQWAMSSARREAGADYWARGVQAHWWAKKYRVTIPRLPRHHQASAALAAYLRVMRNAPIMYAPFAQRGEGPPLGHRLEEAALGGLSAWVRSRTKMHESIRTTLAAVGEPQEVLLRELPGAVLTELADLDAAASDPEKFAALLSEVSERGVDRYLTNRVTARLRAAGKDVERSSDLAGQLEGTDRDIEDFVLREEVRQQLDALEQAAAFSPQEAQVWQLLRKDMDIGEIAVELSIPKGQVSVVAHRARRKAREAREAAGF
jgi:hypothetical protein